MAAKFSLLALMVLGSQGSRIDIPGDVVIGGLFPVHHRSDQRGCGRINGERGVQRLEAMLFALDRINQDPSLLTGISLGATILDTCSSGEHALKQSLHFVDPPADARSFKCADGSLPSLDKGNRTVKAVIGGSYSEVSQKVASFLGLFQVPQISPASTATSLQDKTRYNLFARTVPPDSLQGLVVADIVRHFNWTYVSLVSSEGLYGDSTRTSFLRAIRAVNVCAAVVEVVPRLANEAAFDDIVRQLLIHRRARVVVLFTHGSDTRGLLAAVKRANVSGHFVWVSSDGWGRQPQIVDRLEGEAEGAIIIELEYRVIPEFDAYMQNLTVQNNERNPWFREYWEDVFQCRVASAEQNNTSMACADTLSLDKSSGYRQAANVQFVVDAVYALAHALDQASKDLCRGQNESYCEALRNLEGEIFFQNYLLNTTFVDIAGSVVRFDALGGGMVPYRIYSYRRLDNSSDYDYVPIGHWEPYALHLYSEKVQWSGGQPPLSVCSSACPPGHVRIYIAGDNCCWLCTATKTALPTDSVQQGDSGSDHS